LICDKTLRLSRISSGAQIFIPETTIMYRIALASITLAAAAFALPAVAAESVGQAASDAATKTGHAVGEAGRKTGHAVAEAGRKTGHAVAEAGRETASAVKKGGSKVKAATTSASETK
jgi:hypothetical protein